MVMSPAGLWTKNDYAGEDQQIYPTYLPVNIMFLQLVKFEVRMAVSMKVTAFWDVTSCDLVDRYLLPPFSG
jgi:hypothetical protein